MCGLLFSLALFIAGGGIMITALGQSSVNIGLLVLGAILAFAGACTAFSRSPGRFDNLH